MVKLDKLKLGLLNSPKLAKRLIGKKSYGHFFTYTEVDSKYLSLLHNLHDDILICSASLSYSASCGAEIGVRILVGYLRAAWVHQWRQENLSRHGEV